MILNRFQEPRKSISNFGLFFSLITVGTLLVGLMIWPAISSSAPLPGQIIVDPNNPAWLKYNGGGPFFMCGPGDPEGFLYRGTRNPDGTRDGDQMELINGLKGTGANSIYLMAVRSHGGDGGSTENPFIDSDPSKGLDYDILDQWETWFAEMENNGIVIFFIFYDDSSRIWDTGDSVGGAESAFLHAIVDNFEHHKNLIWCVAEEYSESYTAERVRNIAAEITAADDYDHVIAVHKLSGIDFSEFADDPNIDQFAIQYIEASASELHDGMVTAWNLAAGRYNLNMSESADYGTGPTARQKNWAVAMGGAYVMGLGWDIASTPITTLEDCGRLVTFMESTNFNEMAPHDELKFGGTEYVLALPGDSYIAYASSLSGDIGLQNMTSGLYDLTWYDVTNGNTVVQTNIDVEAGNVTWSKPVDIGNELAVYIRRLNRLISGLGETSGGYIEAFAEDYSHTDWVRVAWSTYNAANGEARVATGDIDGDGRDEVVLGLGPVSGNPSIPDGWFEILDDDHTHLAWGWIHWPAYNNANGESWPACGDVDGDGKDEIIMGLGSYPAGGGYMEVFDYDAGSVTHKAWPYVHWPAYNSANGETRPACGDIDGDGKDEIVVGLSQDGWGYLEVLDDASSGYAHLAWPYVHWGAYNSANGETRPACGDIDGDGKDEIIVGLGQGGWGYLEVLDDASSGYAHLAWPYVHWGAYNSANGETWAAVKN